MGLDMYLSSSKVLRSSSKNDAKLISYLDTIRDKFEVGRSTYISEYNDPDVYRNLNDHTLYGQVGTLQEVRFINGVWIVTSESVYWRKANQIHNWFVENVQDGVDDCQPYDVRGSHLILLQQQIDEVLKDGSLADELLPSSAGFFFGSTDYNDTYYRELKYTRTVLRRLLKPSTLKHWSFHYCSSW